MELYRILFIFVMVIIFVIWIILYINNKLPHRDARIKKEYKAELEKETKKRDAKIKEEYKAKIEKKAQKIDAINMEQSPNVKYLKADEVAKYFKIEKKDLYQIIHKLKWSTKSSGKVYYPKKTKQHFKSFYFIYDKIRIIK